MWIDDWLEIRPVLHKMNTTVELTEYGDLEDDADTIRYFADIDVTVQPKHHTSYSF